MGNLQISMKIQRDQLISDNRTLKYIDGRSLIHSPPRPHVCTCARRVRVFACSRARTSSRVHVFASHMFTCSHLYLSSRVRTSSRVRMFARVHVCCRVQGTPCPCHSSHCPSSHGEGLIFHGNRMSDNMRLRTHNCSQNSSQPSLL